MKRISNLSILLEKQEITIGVGEAEPFKDQPITIQFPFTYSWTVDDASKGTTDNLVKFIQTETGGGAKKLKDQLLSADASQVIGIFRDNKNTVDQRLFRKDLSSIKGWIYLFKKDSIDLALVPADKKLGKIGNNETIFVDSDFKKYLKKAESSAGSNQSKPPVIIDSRAFLSPDGKAAAWYNNDKGVRQLFLTPVTTKIGKSVVGVTSSGEITPIFWTFMQHMPEGLAIDKPAAPAAQQIYAEELKTAIDKFITKVRQFDKINFGSVNTNKLSATLYENMVDALIVLALNAGVIDLNQGPTSENFKAEPYYKPFKKAAEASDAIVKVDPNASAGNTVSGSTSASTFDGTQVTTELELAKIFSGIMSSTETLDTIDSVKTKYNSLVGANKWDDAIKTLPWKKGTTPTNEHFRNFQNSVLNVVDYPYGNQTAEAFKKNFDKSKIK